MRHSSRLEDESTELSTIGHFSEDYGDEPIFKCQNCASKNPGYEEKEASLLTIIAAVICLIIFRLYSFLILPLVVESTKTIIKKCVKCDHVLDKQELLSMPSLTDKILSFKCGSCAMVISRKYALVIIAILSIIWFLIPSSPSTVVNPGGLHLDATWKDFVEDCGKKVVLSNQVRAKRNFDNKYANNHIAWVGVAQALIPHKDISNNPFIGHIVMAKMNPSDSKTNFPDIQIIFSNSLAGKFAKVLNIMKPGDVFEFKGILRAMGDEFHFHDVEAVDIHLTGEHIKVEDIPEIVYAGNANNMRKPKSQEVTADSETSKQPTAGEKIDGENQQKTDDITSQTPPVERQESIQATPENIDNTPEPIDEPITANDQSNDQTISPNSEPDQISEPEPEPIQDNGIGDDQVPMDEPVGDSSISVDEPQGDSQSSPEVPADDEPNQADAQDSQGPDSQDNGINTADPDA